MEICTLREYVSENVSRIRVIVDLPFLLLDELPIRKTALQPATEGKLCLDKVR